MLITVDRYHFGSGCNADYVIWTNNELSMNGPIEEEISFTAVY